MDALRPYAAAFSSRFLLMMQYRAAALAGFFTQCWFGAVHVMVIGAFYLGAPEAAAASPITLTQAITLDFLESGQFAAHIRRRRIAYKAQRDALCGALTRRLGHVLDVDTPDQGMHLIAYFRDGRSDVEAEIAAAAKGLTARAISPLFHDVKPRRGLLLGFTGFPVQAMDGGVARLAGLLGA